MSLSFFTPGPSQIHPNYAKHFQSAMGLQLASHSHRTSLFKQVYQHNDEQLRHLMQIPKSHSIFFASSATEIWERLILNTVGTHSFHLVNGAFSNKCYQFAQALHKKATAHQVAGGLGFTDLNTLVVPENIELISTTQNETSTGAITSTEELINLKKNNPHALIATDLVSTAPYANIDYNYMDSAYFSVQKAFGMGAALGVWIVNEACIEKSASLKKNNSMIGAHNTLSDYAKNYKTFETPSTPNMLAIYILGKIAEDFNKIGIHNIRKTTEQKAQFIYSQLAHNPNFSAFVENEKHQSQTVTVFNSKVSSATVIAEAKKENMVIGSGYGLYKDAQIRIANFPSTTMEEVEQLMKHLNK